MEAEPIFHSVKAFSVAHCLAGALNLIIFAVWFYLACCDPAINITLSLLKTIYN